MELFAGIIVALAALALVMEPLFRASILGSSAIEVERASPEENREFDELESPKIKALMALREIEFDRATGKLSDEDYLALKSRYSKRALEAIEAEESREGGEADEVEAVIRRARDQLRTPVCPSCGPRLEGDAAFCSECGRSLVDATAAPRCAACGNELEADAKFCADCGAPVSVDAEKAEAEV